jgi:hypothetical protein
MGISEATFYVRRKRYGNLDLFKECEPHYNFGDKNARLKRSVADLMLDRNILREEAVKKRFIGLPVPRYCQGHKIVFSRACSASDGSSTCG